MGLGKYDGEMTWEELSAKLIVVCGSMIEVMYEARELREDFRVVAGGRDDATLAADLGAPDAQAITDARAAVGALADLFDLFEGGTVTAENFADHLRRFS